MESDTESLRLSWASGVARIDPEEWAGLRLPADYPFLDRDWLELMETTGSATPEKGWMPCHLLAHRDERLVAVAPLYVKGHSTGEFVFDQAFADVARRIGVAYYPKFLGMSPFTPAAGYRFLFASGEDQEYLTGLLLAAMEGFARNNGINVSSLNFVDESMLVPAQGLGYHAWNHQSYVWENPGYQGFADYLDALRSNKRRAVKRERASLRREGIQVRAMAGDQIPDHLFERMYDLYVLTNSRFGPWGCKFLSEEFFTGLGAVRDRLLFTAAFAHPADEEPLAMAMFCFKGGGLYGRYWGAFEHVPFLHFELCYYAPIEWAIARGISFFDPGMGGEHKAFRGFVSRSCASLHRFFDERLQTLFAANIERINDLEEGEIEAMNELLPYAGRELP